MEQPALPSHLNIVIGSGPKIEHGGYPAVWVSQPSVPASKTPCLSDQPHVPMNLYKGCKDHTEDTIQKSLCQGSLIYIKKLMKG
jgi:hypothetical protein